MKYKKAKLKKILKNCKSIIVLTGAGVSAESGIPTFRGRGGLWKEYNAQDLATPQAFSRNPELVWKFYDYRRQIIGKADPNHAHITLAEWEKNFPDFHIVTQNIDGLHQRADSKNILEIHGNIWEAKCLKENRIFLFDQNPVKEFPPLCPECKSLIRPNVVWFGENLPQNILNESFNIAERADLAFIIGTSSVVYPAAYIPHITKENGGKLVEINIEETPLTSKADLFFKGKAGEIMQELSNSTM